MSACGPTITHGQIPDLEILTENAVILNVTTSVEVSGIVAASVIDKLEQSNHDGIVRLTIVESVVEGENLTIRVCSPVLIAFPTVATVVAKSGREKDPQVHFQ